MISSNILFFFNGIVVFVVEFFGKENIVDMLLFDIFVERIEIVFVDLIINFVAGVRFNIRREDN